VVVWVWWGGVVCEWWLGVGGVGGGGGGVGEESIRRGRMERVYTYELDYLLHSNASWETRQPGLSLSDFFLKS